MTFDRDPDYPSNGDLFREGSLVASALASRRSDKLLRLFNFLLEQSLQGAVPSEAEVAAAVQSKLGAGGEPSGSSARVYISRLRKMLDQHYEDHVGPRLVIPRGEYRIELVVPLLSKPSHMNGAPRTRTKWITSGKVLLAAIVGLNLALASLFWSTGHGRQSALRDTKFWQPIASERFPTVVMVGDHFLFGEIRNGEVDDIVRDFAVHSREEFHKIKVAQPVGDTALVDLDLNYVSSNVVFALRSVLVATESLGLGQPVVSAVPASQVDPGIFNSNNIVYTGPLDGMGRLLADPLSRASSFTFGPSGHQLTDRLSDRIWRSDLAIEADTEIPRRDYGYIASVPGPSGNRILVISGLGDAGIAQMADLAASAEGLAELASRVGGDGDSFEAVYQVRAMYTQSYGRKLLAVRPIGDQGLWDVAEQDEVAASPVARSQQTIARVRESGRATADSRASAPPET